MVPLWNFGAIEVKALPFCRESKLSVPTFPDVWVRAANKLHVASGMALLQSSPRHCLVWCFLHPQSQRFFLRAMGKCSSVLGSLASQAAISVAWRELCGILQRERQSVMCFYGPELQVLFSLDWQVIFREKEEVSPSCIVHIPLKL